MYKIFIPKPLPSVPLVPFLAENLQQGNRLFQDIAPEAYEGIFERVSSASKADIVVAPHEYMYLQARPEYFAQCREYARAAHILLLVSAYQDDPCSIEMPGVIIIRPSAYRSKLSAMEILMPAYVEDVGVQWKKDPLPKGEKPIVAFTGKAGFLNFKEHLRYVVRNYIVRRGPHKQGLYFRRRVLAALASDSRIVLNAIVRKKYSAHRHTIEVPPEQAREEYVRSIQSAHFTLTPRGDGNYSLRFYETLSLGRIPVVIDTDMPLPLEDQIDYGACIVRVPWQDIDNAGDYIVRFYEEHTEAQFIEAQRRARNLFESYLYMPRFLEVLFTSILPKRVASLH